MKNSSKFVLVALVLVEAFMCPSRAVALRLEDAPVASGLILTRGENVPVYLRSSFLQLVGAEESKVEECIRTKAPLGPKEHEKSQKLMDALIDGVCAAGSLLAKTEDQCMKLDCTNKSGQKTIHVYKADSDNECNDAVSKFFCKEHEAGCPAEEAQREGAAVLGDSKAEEELANNVFSMILCMGLSDKKEKLSTSVLAEKQTAAKNKHDNSAKVSDKPTEDGEVTPKPAEVGHDASTSETETHKDGAEATPKPAEVGHDASTSETETHKDGAEVTPKPADDGHDASTSEGDAESLLKAETNKGEERDPVVEQAVADTRAGNVKEMKSDEEAARETGNVGLASELGSDIAKEEERIMDKLKKSDDTPTGASGATAEPSVVTTPTEPLPTTTDPTGAAPNGTE